jgi:LDH2 family malate/lactate/ureidoglycolate dehydrogenase
MQGERTMVPGEPEHELATARRADGIPFDAGAVEALSRVADDLGVTSRPSGFE